jgi:hypothetical protein
MKNKLVTPIQQKYRHDEPGTRLFSCRALTRPLKETHTLPFTFPWNKVEGTNTKKRSAVLQPQVDV